MKRSRRPVNNPNQILQPIREEDFTEIKKLLEKENILTEYARTLCLCHMSNKGYINNDKANFERLDVIISRIQEEGELPKRFKTVRDILLKVKEKKDFDRILEEIEICSI